MPGSGAQASPPLAVSEPAASLRHDLVNPISLVVGYCELLAAEASDQGWGALVAPLGSIRRLALTLLAKIDHALLGHPAHPGPEAIRHLGEDLLGLVLLLIQETDALIRSVAGAEGEAAAALSDDLAKVREAGVHLAVLIESLDAPTPADA